MGRCSASTISPSVTVSHRQMTRPYRGFFLNESSLFLGGKVPEHCALAGIGKVLFFYGFQAAATQQLHRLFRYGRRGGKSRERIPARLIKPGACLDSSIIKSSCWV